MKKSTDLLTEIDKYISFTFPEQKKVLWIFEQIQIKLQGFLERKEEC